MTDAHINSRQHLFAKLSIKMDDIPPEQLANYTAVRYYLTQEDTSSTNATNLESVNSYLETFYHLCEVKDWQRGSLILLESIRSINY